MSSDTRKERMESTEIGRREARIAKMEKALERLAEGLPLFDQKEFARAVEAVEDYPNVALRGLCRRMASKDPRARAVASWVIAETLSPQAAERLKAMVFDELAPEMARAQATEFLNRIGEPIDPDMLDMSLPNAEDLLSRLPARVIDAAREGDIDGAAAKFAELSRPLQAVLIHRAGAELKGGAAPFYENVVDEDEFLAEAVLSAVSAHRLGECAGLVARLSHSSSKKVHKLAKKVQYELKTAGVSVPDSAPASKNEGAAQDEVGDDVQPFYKAMISEPQQDGAVFACAAVEKSNGKLKALSLVIDPWRGGIENAAFRQNISKSSFGRTLKTWQQEMKMREADGEEIRDLAARGLAASKALETRIPVDFQLGKAMLGDLDARAAALGAPFRCVGCGAALGAEEVERLKDAAIYPHVKVEKRCRSCREAGA